MIGKDCRMFMHKLNLIKFGRAFYTIDLCKMSTLVYVRIELKTCRIVEMVCNLTLADLIRYNLCSSCNNSTNHTHTKGISVSIHFMHTVCVSDSVRITTQTCK